jgi:hypothetical protein
MVNLCNFIMSIYDFKKKKIVTLIIQQFRLILQPEGPRLAEIEFSENFTVKFKRKVPQIRVGRKHATADNLVSYSQNVRHFGNIILNCPPFWDYCPKKVRLFSHHLHRRFANLKQFQTA